MLVEVDIIDRIYRNIEDFCCVNGLDVNEYIINAIVERYNLDKYGDLNEKLVKIETKVESDSLNRYIHIKTGNPYSVITDNFMFKDNGEWCRGLVLYKSEYYNSDGEYFARTKEDFCKNFIEESAMKISPKENKEETNEVVIVKEEDKKDITVLSETEKKEEKPKRTRRTLKTK